MTSRLEDDLRAALAGAPAPVLTLDPEAVLRGGRRSMLTRRVIRAGVVAVAVAAIGVAGTQLTAPRHSGAPASTRDQAGQPPIAMLQLPGEGRFAVAVVSQDPDNLDLDFHTVGSDGRLRMVGSQSTSAPGEVVWGTVADHIVLGVLPAGARQVRAFTGVDGSTPVGVTTAAVPGTDLEAFGARVPTTATGTDQLTRVLWTAADGRAQAFPPSASADFMLSGGSRLTVTLDRTSGSPVMRAEALGPGGTEDLGSTPAPQEWDRTWHRVVTTREGAVLLYGIDRRTAPELHPAFEPGSHSIDTNTQTEPLPGEDYRAFVIEVVSVDGHAQTAGQLSDVGYANAPPTWSGNHYR